MILGLEGSVGREKGGQTCGSLKQLRLRLNMPPKQIECQWQRVCLNFNNINRATSCHTAEGCEPPPEVATAKHVNHMAMANISLERNLELFFCYGL